MRDSDLDSVCKSQSNSIKANHITLSVGDRCI